MRLLRPLILMAAALSCGCGLTPERRLTAGERAMIQDTAVGLPSSLHLGDIDRRELQRMVETPIEFAGVVQDPAGSPIAGAEVRVLVYDDLVFPIRFPYFDGQLLSLKTNDKGRFKVKTRGAYILIDARHEGYFAFDESPRAHYFAPEFAGIDDEPLPGPDNPIVLELLPQEEAGDIARIITGSIRIPPGKTRWGVRFGEPNPNGVPPSEAELVVAIPPIGPAVITAPGGGVKVVDEALHRAPVSGYLPSYSITTASEIPDRGEAHLFARLGDGAYARVFVVGHRHPGQRPWFSVHGYVNRDGPILR